MESIAVFAGGEGLARGPADVLGTLLHEAAHALAHVPEEREDEAPAGRDGELGSGAAMAGGRR